MRSRTEKALAAMTASMLAALVPWFASCATADATNRAPADDAASMVLPERDAADEADVADGEVDSGCDASDSKCVSTALSCDQAAWCPVPTTVSTLFSLTAVWGSSKSDVWAVGSGGTIIHNDGAAWKITPTTVHNTFHAVWGTGPNDVWAVSMTDAIFHSNGFVNGSAEWTLAPAAKLTANDTNPRIVLSIWGAPGGDLRIGTRARAVFDPSTGLLPFFNQYTKTDVDGGVGWTRVEGMGTVHGFWGSSATDLWLIADDSERNGWQRGITMHGTPALDAGDGGAELAWQAVDSQSSLLLEAIWGSSANDVWAVGDEGVIRHLTAGATRWEIVPSPTTNALHAIWGSAANDVWAVGDFGTILHWDGATWSASTAAVPVGTKRHLYGIWGSSANDVWIVGDGISLHYTGPKPGAGGR
jgi:hypothetical protein